MDDKIDELAARLRAAQEHQTPIAPIRDEVPGGTVDAAYEIQAAVTNHAIASGRRLVGRKTGLTSVAVQRQLGVDRPDFGALFADTIFCSGEPVPQALVLQARVEAEVAIVLGRDLPDEDVTLVELLGAIDHLLPAIEIVASRIAGWDISILDTVADNASSGAVVLGTKPVAPGTIDLAAAGMLMEVDGRVASVGSGAACLGHPYVAALWLARTVAALGTPLRAGDLVMTGALGPMVDLPVGSGAVATIQGLGTVSVSLES